MNIFVIPAYNEEKNIGSLLAKMKEKLAGSDYSIIIVNDGSRDKTKQIALDYGRSMPVTVIDHDTNQGVGQVFRTGFKAALARAKDEDIIITKEADNTSDLSVLDEMISAINKGDDLSLASCYAPGGKVIGTSLYRKLMSWGANQLVKLIVPIKGIHTYSSFYRAYRAGFLKKAFALYGDNLIEEGGFVCMVELLVKLGKMKPKVTEVPMVLNGNIREGKSKMRTKATIMAYFKLIAKQLLKRGG
jgi:dolichol-phosphate mannosyltransferase